MAAEFGVPLWKLGATTYACAGSERIVCAYSKAGLGQLAVLDLKAKVLRPFKTPFTEFSSVRVSGDRAVFRAGASNHPAGTRSAFVHIKINQQMMERLMLQAGRSARWQYRRGPRR